MLVLNVCRVGVGISFTKEVISGWSAGCDEGAEVSDHKEWSQHISIHS